MLDNANLSYNILICRIHTLLSIERTSLIAFCLYGILPHTVVDFRDISY